MPMSQTHTAIRANVDSDDDFKYRIRLAWRASRPPLATATQSLSARIHSNQFWVRSLSHHFLDHTLNGAVASAVLYAGRHTKKRKPKERDRVIDLPDRNDQLNMHLLTLCSVRTSSRYSIKHAKIKLLRRLTVQCAYALHRLRNALIMVTLSRSGAGVADKIIGWLFDETSAR